MSGTAAIIQSSYIPWKGYFDIIASADIFIFLDDVQYTKRDWRNRNKIKTDAGTKWLTIPVAQKGKYEQRIFDTEISGVWAKNHLATIEHSYAKAPHFKTFLEDIRKLYGEIGNQKYLSMANQIGIKRLCGMLGIRTSLTLSTDYFSLEVLDSFSSSERLVELCKASKADHYLSGPSAQSYMDMDLFRKAGIEVRFADYSRYPEYPQLHGAFTHQVSILDVLFNLGDSAPKYSLGFAF